MSSPVVSVVIPTFNRAYCIQRTVDSVLQQTYDKVQCLVVDDGSTDNTRELMADLYGNEPRVVYIHQKNQGVCAARNTGLGRATGEFIALLDSDDIWKPWKLEVQLACLDRFPEAGMVWSDMEAIDDQDNVIDPRYLRTMYSAYQWFSSDDLFERSLPLTELTPGLRNEVGDGHAYTGDIFSQMVMGNLVHTSTVLLRRERQHVVGGFNLYLKRSGEDYDFHLRTCRYGPVAFVDCATILYRRGAADQLTAPEYTIDRAQNFLRTIEPYINNDREHINLPDWMLDEVLADAHAWIGEEQLNLEQRWAGRRHLVTSLRHKPRQPRLLGLLALSMLPRALSEPVRGMYRQVKQTVRRG